MFDARNHLFDADRGNLQHRQIMTDFSSPQICSKPYESRPRSVTKPSLLPTLKPEDPLNVLNAVICPRKRICCSRKLLSASSSASRSCAEAICCVVRMLSNASSCKRLFHDSCDVKTILPWTASTPQ